MEYYEKKPEKEGKLKGSFDLTRFNNVEIHKDDDKWKIILKGKKDVVPPQTDRVLFSETSEVAKEWADYIYSSIMSTQ